MPVGDMCSLQDAGLALPCLSSLAMAWGRWHSALSGLQWQHTRGSVAVLERWACRNLTELSRDKYQVLHLWERKVSGRSTVWGQRGCRKPAVWERPPRCCQVPGEAVPSPSKELFKSGSGKSLRNLIWSHGWADVGFGHLRSFSTWNTLSCNSVTNYLFSFRFEFEFCLCNLTCMSKMLHAQSVLSQIQLTLVPCV